MSGPRWIPTMLLITAFQLISFAQVIFVEDGINYFAATILAIYLLIEWGWSITSSFVLRKSSPAIEFVAFFLTGIGLAVVASKGTSSLFTQFLAVALGFALYVALLWMLANIDRVEKFQVPMEVIAIGLLAIGLIFASNSLQVSPSLSNWRASGLPPAAKKSMPFGQKRCDTSLFQSYISCSTSASGW